MEGTQESTTVKPSTKSSRKRQRKKQAAALEKNILASEAAGFCKLEPLENSNRESVKIKGCLSNIVFNYNSVKEKECPEETSSPCGIVSPKARSVCCEPSENVVLEKTQSTEPESAVPQIKRRRNRRKVLASEVPISSDSAADPLAQKSIEKQSTHNGKASQKYGHRQERFLLNHCVDPASFADKTYDLKKVEAAGQLDNKSDVKSLCEAVDRESTLSRSKRRRNRKKGITSLEHGDPHSKIVDNEDLKIQKTHQFHPQDFLGQLSPQKGCPSGQGFNLKPSIVSENPAPDKTVQPEVNKSACKSGEVSVDNLSRKPSIKEVRPQDSELPKNIGVKNTGDPSCSNPPAKGEEKVVEGVDFPQEPLVLKKEECVSDVHGASVVKSKCSEKDKAIDGQPLREKEKRLSSPVFQIKGDPSKLSDRAEDQTAGMAEAKKIVTKVGPVPKESVSKDKRKVLDEGVSKFASASIMATPSSCDEVDRASASIHSLKVSPQSGSVRTFISKTMYDPKDISAGMTAVSKGGAYFKKVAPVSSEMLDESVVCVDRVKVENKNEKGSENVPKSDNVGDSMSKGENSVMEKPDINAFVIKEKSSIRKAVTVSSEGEKIGNTFVLHRGDGITLQKLCTEGETASESWANLKIISDVNLVKEALEVVGESSVGKDNSRAEKILETMKKDNQSAAVGADVMDKMKEKVVVEREARKAAKLAKKLKDKAPVERELVAEALGTQSTVPHENYSLNKKGVSPMEGKPIAAPPKVLQEGEKSGVEKSKAELRAERRAKQEAQRAAKLASSKAPSAQSKVKTNEPNVAKVVPLERGKAATKQPSSSLKGAKKEQGVKLLSRLGWGDGRVKRSPSEDATLIETQSIHPAIVQLSTKFTDRIVSGSNARCLAFVQAIKKAILDYQTPPQKELGRDLEARLLTPSLAYLESQRPHAVSVSNATKFLKWQLTQLQPLQQNSIENSTAAPSETKKLADNSDEEAKQILIEGLDAYIWEKIEVAERAVCETLKDKIKDGDVILTYGCSYLLQQILTDAKKSGTKFKVVVVDGRPWREGREMLRCLVAVGIPCSYVLLSAASSVMRQVNKVLLGAHALLSNGYVMSRVGVSQVALLASAHNVPVLVACETHKFCERVQSDSFVYNEMGEPDGLAQLLGGEDGPLTDWRSIPSLSLLNLSYDVTPPELVTAVATELAVLPCTSVPVVLRVRPAEPITSRH